MLARHAQTALGGIDTVHLDQIASAITMITELLGVSFVGLRRQFYPADRSHEGRLFAAGAAMCPASASADSLGA
jgi:hypothetical protein